MFSFFQKCRCASHTGKTSINACFPCGSFAHASIKKTSKTTSEIIPKSSKNEVPRPSENRFEKTTQNNANEIEKVSKIVNLGVPGGGQRTSFFDPFSTLGRPGGPWGPRWPSDRPPGPPRPPQTSIFHDFGPLLERIFAVCLCFFHRFLTILC